MPRVVIDNHNVEVNPGATILDAARKLGLDIPTLCFLDGHKSAPSCMVCLVKVKNPDRVVPACATMAEEGMRIESQTDEVHRLRKGALELLLSDHAGDCVAPCRLACPAHMDIPQVLRQVAGGEPAEAIAIIKRDMALPATLARICPGLCARGCRRGDVDGSLSIALIVRYVTDGDLASKRPYLPPCQPAKNKAVAIVGAGPTGLSAAYHLLQEGYVCTLFDRCEQPGGRLRFDFDERQLPREVLDAEIDIVRQLGAEYRMAMTIGPEVSIGDLKKDFDAVLVAVGSLAEGDSDRLGLRESKCRLRIDMKTHETLLPGVFAAGDAVRSSRQVVRAVADGKAVAFCIAQYLSGLPVTGLRKMFSSRMGHLEEAEKAVLMAGVEWADRAAPARDDGTGLTDEQARDESLRCWQCACGKADICRLREYATRYGADPYRYAGRRKGFERHLQHADIIYEPGKCIVCGLCVRIAEEVGESLGLTFVGRGFDVRVGVPFDRSIAEGLQVAATRCAEACPTGALSLRADRQ